MKTWNLFALVLLLPSLVLANDAAVQGEGGRWNRLSEGSTPIRMESETVLLDLDQTLSYRVTADFVFRNTGRATTVKMGFPEKGYGDITAKDYRKDSAWTQFVTTVDGQKTPVQRQRADLSEMEYTAFWVKLVPFGAGQTRRVRVSYRAPYGGRADFINTFALYNFTGGNWKGTVNQSVLTVRLSRPGAYVVNASEGKVKPSFVRRGRDFIYTWKNWQAEEGFAFLFTKTAQDWLAWADRDPRQRGSFAVKVPGKSNEKVINYIPDGLVKNGRIFVNLREWVDRDEKLKAEIKVVPGGIQVVARQKTVTYSTKSTAPDGPFQLGNPNISSLFVPAAQLQKDFGVRFAADMKAHRIRVLP